MFSIDKLLSLLLIVPKKCVLRKMGQPGEQIHSELRTQDIACM